jgi:hypothetical protein
LTVLVGQVTEAIRHGTRKQLAGAIVAEAERLLAGPWPPLD